MSDRSDDARLAARLVHEAADLAATMRREQSLDIATKTSVSDLVTTADHAAEEHIVSALHQERPDDGLLGEEGTAEAGRSGRRWVIDPVDGTYNFATGSDYWCSALALVDGDELVLGAVAHHRDGVLVGGPELATTLDGEPVSRIDDPALATAGVATYLHPAHIGSDDIRTPFLRAVSGTATVRMLGSGSMDLSGVVTGRLGGWFQHSTPPWDWLPGAALVQGAGGTTAQVTVGGVVWSIAGGAGVVAGLRAALEGAS